MNKQLMQDIVRREVTSWSKAILFWDEQINWADVENCLEIGAGEGGLSLWLAWKEKQVICSDTQLSNKAKQLHAKYKAASKIEYEEIDATGIPYEDYFDVIIFKSVLSDIGKGNKYNLQEQAIKEMYKALKPGGKLLFAEHLRASALHVIFRKALQPGSKKMRYLSLTEMKTLMKKFSSVDVKTTGFLSFFGRNETQRKRLSAYDEKWFNNLVPQRWHYIAYGIAEK